MKVVCLIVCKSSYLLLDASTTFHETYETYTVHSTDNKLSWRKKITKKIAPPAIARAATSSPSVLRGWSIPLHSCVCCYSFEYIDKNFN
ncbi:hypothetical protein C0J52_23524 [Blattella germanica]|nr:hypothetical protein C0J52_23524 [Blattella germanica]